MIYQGFKNIQTGGFSSRRISKKTIQQKESSQRFLGFLKKNQPFGAPEFPTDGWPVKWGWQKYLGKSSQPFWVAQNLYWKYEIRLLVEAIFPPEPKARKKSPTPFHSGSGNTWDVGHLLRWKN